MAGTSNALVGAVVKFTLPVVANGMVFVGTSSAFVGYGLLNGPTNAPTNLTATPKATVGAAGEIDLSWTNNSNVQTSVSILRSLDGSSFVPIATTTSATQNTYQDTGLNPNTTYFYQVIANFGQVQSRPSNAVTRVDRPDAGRRPDPSRPR